MSIPLSKTPLSNQLHGNAGPSEANYRWLLLHGTSERYAGDEDSRWYDHPFIADGAMINVLTENGEMQVACPAFGLGEFNALKVQALSSLFNFEF